MPCSHSSLSACVLAVIVKSVACSPILFLHSPSTVVAISLDTPVTDQDIATVARDYLVRWEELAPHLGLTVQQEQSIRQTFREYEDQKREVLRTWKRNKGNGATYHILITAAETISNMQLADNVRALLKEHTSTGL